MSGDHGSSTNALRTRELENKLVAASIISDEEIDRALAAYLLSATPLNGARIIARAWLDNGFRQRALTDANAAIRELGLSMGGGTQETRLKIVENTPARHNIIVCTLCSCYPIMLLGPSPTWYKSEAYRSKVVRNPREVLQDFHMVIAEHVEITVWDASADIRFMVLPMRPANTDRLSEQELAELVTREGLLGTGHV